MDYFFKMVEVSKLEILLVFGGLFIMLVLVAIIFFKKRGKSNSHIQGLEDKIEFQSALQSSLLEIREERTLAFSKELHDNVGQILSVALMQLNMQIDRQTDDYEKENSIAIKSLVEKSLDEIRFVSKASLADVQDEVLFTDLVQQDLQRIELLKNIECHFSLVGDRPFNIPMDHQIIVYRMLQEIINNILKHSQSRKIDLEIVNTIQNCFIRIQDYGKGFVVKGKIMSGVGLRNIKSRAKLINAKCEINSKIGQGTELTIDYPYL
ncbi:ATP-binding protein [Soonwooa sp.]|uniref:sensor histidine kinase n=1 Tax=Soonwooa sp. TaxID=1938592 RepID=UPI00262978B8|nr:ATP-binding protein [Soonwooa sp.]